MESNGFFIMNRERFIGQSYGKVSGVSLMFCYDEIVTGADTQGPRTTNSSLNN
jgi:hypothetical protein